MELNKKIQKRFCMFDMCILDEFPAMVWISDVKNDTLKINKSWKEFTGVNDTIIPVKDWYKYVYEDDIEKCKKIINNAKEKNEKFYLEFRVKNKDGNYYWVSTIANPIIENGVRIGFIASTIDIDDNVKVKKLLSENEQLYRRLFDSMSEPVILFDTESFRIVDVNPAAIKKYGYSRFEFLTMHVFELSSQIDLSKKYIENRHTYTPLRYHKNKDGFIFPVEISTSYFKVNNKEFSVNIIRDTVDRTK